MSSKFQVGMCHGDVGEASSSNSKQRRGAELSHVMMDVAMLQRLYYNPISQLTWIRPATDPSQTRQQNRRIAALFRARQTPRESNNQSLFPDGSLVVAYKSPAAARRNTMSHMLEVLVLV